MTVPKFRVRKVADWKYATLLKKRLMHRCFLVSFAKLLRTYFAEPLQAATS